MKIDIRLALSAAVACASCGQSESQDLLQTPQITEGERPELRQRTPAMERANFKADLVSCAGTGASCDTGQTCCAPGFCSFELNVYSPGECLAPMEDGNFCTQDVQCQSGQCVQGTCRSAACLFEGEQCSSDPSSLPCCEGTLCLIDPSGYAIERCTAPLPDGQFCFEDRECQSEHCDENECKQPAPAECYEPGEACYVGLLPCCEGSFCAWDNSAYGVAFCSPLLETGAFCQDDGDCQSGSCEAAVCG